MRKNLVAGELWIKHHVFWQVADVLADFGVASFAIQNRHLTLGWCHQPQNQLDTGRFASAVVAKQPKNLPGLKPQINAIQHQRLVVLVAHILKTKTTHRDSGCNILGGLINGCESVTPAALTTGNAS